MVELDELDEMPSRPPSSFNFSRFAFFVLSGEGKLSLLLISIFFEMEDYSMKRFFQKNIISNTSSTQPNDTISFQL